MKKIFLVFVLTLFSFTKVYAASGSGAATEYTVTMKKVELCEDSACATSYTVATKDMPVDIASASAGTDIGSYAPTTGLTLGKTYTHLRVTISRTFTATGRPSSWSSARKTSAIPPRAKRFLSSYLPPKTIDPCSDIGQEFNGDRGWNTFTL